MNQTIPDLPEHLRVVPENRHDWFVWRQQILAFRTIMRREADSNLEIRAGIIRFCQRDYAYAMIMLGCLLEPKNVRDFAVSGDGELVEFTRRRGWYPWIPYGFQIEVLREIKDALESELDDTGKDDIFAEKSREMGLTWIFCFQASMDWLFADDVLVGMYSHKEDLVDSDSPKSMFYKVKSLVGINRKVSVKCHSPETIFHGVPVRIPDWLVPSGFDPKNHDRKLNLIHPTKTNQIMGESTTGKSGIGDRTNYNILDEVAKHKEFYNMWSNQSSVTDHRFALTSADRRESDDAYLLAEQARAARADPKLDGPRLISLPWQRHPLRDAKWERRMRARHAGDAQGFAREFDIDWNAGLGDWVYPSAKLIEPGDFPYLPILNGKGSMYCCIDPGVRDPTAVHWIEHVEDRYRVVESIVLKTPSARFLAPILLGFPQGHEVRNRYGDQSIMEVMDFTWQLRKDGVKVTFVGDPWGNNRQGGNGESFYEVLQLDGDELTTQYASLNVPYMELAVQTNYEKKAVDHIPRKLALEKRLSILDFNRTPRVMHALTALQNNRYKTQDERRQVQSEASGPAHDWTSHATTAFEFWAVNSTITELVDASINLSPVNTNARKYQRRQPAPGWVIPR